MYCSQLCQRTDWRSHHRLECRKIKEERSLSWLDYLFLANTALIDYSDDVLKCDKDYLLAWVLVQLRRHISSIRKAAATRFPKLPLEKVVLVVIMHLGPMRILFYPLERDLYENDSKIATTSEVMHYRNLTLQKVVRGEKDATMLMIRYSDGRCYTTMLTVVSLDKTASEVPHLGEGWKSTRQSIEEFRHNIPMTADPDDIDNIIELIRKTAEQSNENIWKPGLIARCINKHLNKD